MTSRSAVRARWVYTHNPADRHDTHVAVALHTVQALRANPDNAGARLEWAPIRGGISADGQHGFTFGYMTVLAYVGALVTYQVGVLLS